LAEEPQKLTEISSWVGLRFLHRDSIA